MRCAVCNAEYPRFVCLWCGSVKYCSSKCKRQDWNHSHRLTCAGIMRLPNSSNNNAESTFGDEDDDHHCGAPLESGKMCCMNPRAVWGYDRTTPLVKTATKTEVLSLLTGKPLGRGGYGTVYEATIASPYGTTSGCNTFAVKLTNVGAAGKPRLSPSVMHETVVRNLWHPNVVGICRAERFDMPVFGEVSQLFERTDAVFATYMDRAHDNLIGYIHELIRESSGSNEDVDSLHDIVLITALQMAMAVEYCHSCGVVHGDIKPHNFLVDGIDVPSDVASVWKHSGKFPRVFLADFGLSRYQAYRPARVADCYTLWYKNPESLLGDRYMAWWMDVWALGCTFYEIAAGAPLFAGHYISDQLQKIFAVTGIPNKADYINDTSGNELSATEWTALGCDYMPKPSTPPYTILDTIAHTVDTDYADLVRMMLAPIPSARPSPTVIVNHRIFDSKLRTIPTMTVRELVTHTLVEYVSSLSGIDRISFSALSEQIRATTAPTIATTTTTTTTAASATTAISVADTSHKQQRLSLVPIGLEYALDGRIKSESLWRAFGRKQRRAPLFSRRQVSTDVIYMNAMIVGTVPYERIKTMSSYSALFMFVDIMRTLFDNDKFDAEFFFADLLNSVAVYALAEKYYNDGTPLDTADICNIVTAHCDSPLLYDAEWRIFELLDFDVHRPLVDTFLVTLLSINTHNISAEIKSMVLLTFILACDMAASVGMTAHMLAETGYRFTVYITHIMGIAAGTQAQLSPPQNTVVLCDGSVVDIVPPTELIVKVFAAWRFFEGHDLYGMQILPQEKTQISAWINHLKTTQH
jgi:serine/threonine protein kinase